MSETVLLLHDDRMLAHSNGPGHPERRERLEAIVAHLRNTGIEPIEWRTPQPASVDAVQAVHSVTHIEHLESLRGRRAQLDPDTGLAPGSVEAAFLAAGAAIDAVTAVVREETRRAFCLVRPPGHHAERDHAMGFCLFNNVAIAAAFARAELGIDRVLIVDWDVHHGNGTEHAFYDRDDILFFSSHRDHFYPGTGLLTDRGAGAGLGFTVNAPLPPGVDDAEMTALYGALLPDLASMFRPNLILVSAGFDAHAADPLGGMLMTADGFGGLCAIVRDLADEHADGRLVLVLEGGYDLQSLAHSTAACIRVMAGATPPEIPALDRASPKIARLMDHARRRHL